MKLLHTRIGRIFLAGASLIVLISLFGFGRDLYYRWFPNVAFRAITGRELPSGVSATAYGSAMTDALFHTTHFWLLAGSPTALRQITNGTGFVESEGARYMVPDLRRMFGGSVVATQVVAGYEWEIARDRWYCIFAGETTAFYAH